MYNPVNIKVAMVQQGLEPQDIVKRTGLSLTTVYGILKGNDIKTSTLEKVANALSCNEAAFYLPVANSKLLTSDAPQPAAS